MRAMASASLACTTPVADSNPAVRHRWLSALCRVGALAGLLLAICIPTHAETPPDAGSGASGQATESSERHTEEAPDRAEQARRAVDRIFDNPLGGVVVNRTVTVLGKDFYQFFSTRWRQTPAASRYTISIYERPTARFGSEIWVLYRQQKVFHAFLPPARAATRELSEIAVQHVLENVSRRESERLTTRNPDLGPEEL